MHMHDTPWSVKIDWFTTWSWIMDKYWIKAIKADKWQSQQIFKEYLEWFSKFAFQEVAHSGGQPNRHILPILLAHRHALVAQNYWTSVRLHHCYFFFKINVFTVWRALSCGEPHKLIDFGCIYLFCSQSHFSMVDY